MTLSFYDIPDLEDGFGATAGRSQPHRGLDFPRGPGVPIPSVNSGEVVISEWNKYLGWVVEVRGDDGVYLGYCHMAQQGLGVGTWVAVGTTIGVVGNTGTQSRGAHLHITKGDRKGAVFGSSMAYLSDPWPYIQTAQTKKDDMYSEDDRKRDNTTAKQVGEIHWMLDKRIRPQLDKLEGILNGKGWGVRHLLGERRDEIAALTEMVKHLAPGKIEDDHSSKPAR